MRMVTVRFSIHIADGYVFEMVELGRRRSRLTRAII